MSNKYKILVSFIVVVALYITCYYATVDAVTPPGKGAIPKSRIPPNVPVYTYFGQLSDIVFYPMNKIDRLLRPKYWNSQLE
jgi:hypothetical protein